MYIIFVNSSIGLLGSCALKLKLYYYFWVFLLTLGLYRPKMTLHNVVYMLILFI